MVRIAFKQNFGSVATRPLSVPFLLRTSDKLARLQRVTHRIADCVTYTGHTGSSIIMMMMMRMLMMMMMITSVLSRTLSNPSAELLTIPVLLIT